MVLEHTPNNSAAFFTRMYPLRSNISTALKRPRSKATLRNYECFFRNCLAIGFAERKLNSIRREHVEALHESIGANHGHISANRTLELIFVVFNDAIAKSWEGRNPCIGIDHFPETSRRRFLEEDESGPFIRGCEEERLIGSKNIADALLFALFTGVRRSNACGAHWSEINLRRRTWDIPASRWKNGEPHRVYLCDYIVELLQGRFELRPNDEWVFPASSKSGHLETPDKTLKRIVHRAGIDPTGINCHCLRHTFLTYADDFGMPTAVRKRLAGHTRNTDVTDGYTHALDRRVRESYENVVRHMLSIALKTHTTSELVEAGSANM